MTDEEPSASALPGASDQGGGDDPDQPAPRPSDPYGVIAIVVGCIGLVILGFVLAIVTAVLASVAGAKARDEHRSNENAYLAFGLAVLDAIVFIVLHYRFHLPAWAG